MQSDVSLIAALVGKAHAAQEQVADYSQEQIDDLCRSVAWQVYCDENIKVCAEIAVEETGMGNVADKITKHKVKVLGSLIESLKGKSVGLIEEDTALGIRKYAKPVGVVGALTPVTNPTATLASNAIAILKGRNAVVFGPHPKAKQSAQVVCDFMRAGLRAVGAPEDLVQHVAEPTLDRSQELMRQVDVVMATGGPGVVKAAYSSGTPAYGVGPGNAVAIVAEDADVEDAAKKIHLSKVFDHATSCSSENSIVVQESVYEQVLDGLRARGAYVCSGAEKDALEKVLWVVNKKGKLGINVKIVAASAAKIADMAGIDVPAGTKSLLVECADVNEPSQWRGEKLSPVLTIWQYGAFDEALAILKALTDYAGTGHSAGIHTFKQEYIESLAITQKSSRIMVRQPMAPGNGGNFFNGMPSTTSLGCGTWAGNSTTENIYWKHFINVTWVSEPFEPVKPTDEEMWGDFWRRNGR
ncbi:MAG: aldehyde dehydrogenase family protein [Lentisphaeria bacterium]|nr:aldehyde dehydrogenase family protein [Lentisphaeria bacterium]